MAKVKDVLRILEEFAPYSLAESWDNCGLLVGNPESDVDRVLCALDITEKVAKEAVEKGAALIVAHHPVIFTSTSSVTMDTVTGKILTVMIQNHLSGICMHTNADSAKGGVNDLLAQRLDLKAIENLGAGDTQSLGRVGNLAKPMALRDFAFFVRRKLNAGGVRFTDGGKKVKRVAVLGGAGGKLMDDAIKKGADTYVIGDCSYDIMMRAHDLGLNLLDAGHFPTENPMAEGFARLIATRLPEIQTIVSSVHRDCIEFI